MQTKEKCCCWEDIKFYVQVGITLLVAIVTFFIMDKQSKLAMETENIALEQKI